MKILNIFCVAVALWLSMLTVSVAQVRLDMRQADLRDFVSIVAESTGRNFILDPRVQGTVTVLAPQEVSPGALYEIFLNVLELNRLTIVEGREADRIVPTDVARELSPAAERASTGGGYQTRIIPVRQADVNEVAETIRPLVPPEAVLTAVPDAGFLILSDRLESFRRISRLVEKLDTPRSDAVETIRLRNAKAEELMRVVQSLDITPDGASISADARANALVISGRAAFRDRVRRLVGELDTPQRSFSTEVIQLDYADAQSLEPVIQKSFGAVAREGEGNAGGGQITVVAEPQQNALVITGPAERIAAVARSIKALDRRPQQVLIEAVVFELSVDNFSDLSAQFGALLGDALVGGVEFSLEGRPTLTGLVSAAASNRVVSPGSGGTIGGVRRSGGNGIAGFLSALTSQTSTRLLSTPSILTLNNEEAKIVVAQNVPFVTGSFATVGESAIPNDPFQTIEREDVGLTLEVVPQITADQNVRLRIRQEVSNLTNAASAAGGEITSKRTLNTNALVRDNHVILLGGLVEDGSNVAEQAVPGLSRAPIIGRLFRGRNVSEQQRVLLILLRPRILQNAAEAKHYTREITAQARAISEEIAPADDGSFPRVGEMRLPFDGADLDQPFEAGAVDPMVIENLMPALPTRLRFAN